MLTDEEMICSVCDLWFCDSPECKTAEANREKVRKWYADNRERKIASVKEWYENNNARRLAYLRERYRLRVKATTFDGATNSDHSGQTIV
jgi:hypothetical protein